MIKSFATITIAGQMAIELAATFLKLWKINRGSQGSFLVHPLYVDQQLSIWSVSSRGEFRLNALVNRMTVGKLHQNMAMIRHKIWFSTWIVISTSSGIAVIFETVWRLEVGLQLAQLSVSSPFFFKTGVTLCLLLSSRKPSFSTSDYRHDQTAMASTSHRLCQSQMRIFLALDLRKLMQHFPDHDHHAFHKHWSDWGLMDKPNDWFNSSQHAHNIHCCNVTNMWNMATILSE